MARARVQPQLAMDELVVEDEAAEEALEARYAAKLRKADVDADYNAAHERAKELVGPLVPAGSEGVIRIGRFRVTRSISKPRSVAFETKGSERLRIDVEGEE